MYTTLIQVKTILFTVKAYLKFQLLGIYKYIGTNLT